MMSAIFGVWTILSDNGSEWVPIVALPMMGGRKIISMIVVAGAVYPFPMLTREIHANH